MGKKKITAKVYRWYNATEGETIPIKNLEKWIVEHGGAVIVRPPAVTGHKWWSLIVTDKTNRFMQK